MKIFLVTAAFPEIRVFFFFPYSKHALVVRKYSAKVSAKIQLFCNCNDNTVQFNCNTKILLRRKLRRPSYLVFDKILKETFSNPF